jgi:hypothetical protein
MQSAMHANHPLFLEALATRHRLSVRFLEASKEKGKPRREVVRVCAPLDFGPLRGAVSRADVYQLWDLEAKRKPWNLVLAEADVVSMTPLDDTFDPAAIITWAFKPHAWHVPRDWAEFS